VIVAPQMSFPVPPLAGAELRLGRAREHIAAIRARIEAIEIAESFTIAAHQEGSLVFLVGHPAQGPPLELSVLVGEVLYNLRSALDYVVFVLAALDSGKPQNGTQFPIEDTPEGFVGRRKEFLRGVNEIHVTRIEEFQPSSSFFRPVDPPV